MRVIYLVVPVYNEAENIPVLLANLAQMAASLSDARLRVVFADDGSSDDTVGVIARCKSELDVEVLSSTQNFGPGRAFARAFSHLGPQLKDDDLVVTMEGDNTSRLETLVTMVERCLRERLDLVLASPYAFGGGFQRTSLFRLILSQCANGFLKSLLGMSGVHTMSSFFRVHTAPAISRLQRVYGPGIIERAGFEGMVEMLKKAMLLELSISEVPMVLRSDLRRGKSKMKVLRTIRGYLALAFLVPEWIRRVDRESR